jgi:hypothetical protein
MKSMKNIQPVSHALLPRLDVPHGHLEIGKRYVVRWAGLRGVVRILRFVGELVYEDKTGHREPLRCVPDAKFYPYPQT